MAVEIIVEMIVIAVFALIVIGVIVKEKIQGRESDTTAAEEREWWDAIK